MSIKLISKPSRYLLTSSLLQNRQSFCQRRFSILNNPPEDWRQVFTTELPLFTPNGIKLPYRIRPLDSSVFHTYPLSAVLPLTLGHESMHSSEYFSSQFKDQLVYFPDSSIKAKIEAVERKEGLLFKLIGDDGNEESLKVTWTPYPQLHFQNQKVKSSPVISLTEIRKVELLMAEASLRKEPLSNLILKGDFAMTKLLPQLYLEKRAKDELCLVLEDQHGEIQGFFLQGKFDTTGTDFDAIHDRIEFQEFFQILDDVQEYFIQVAQANQIPYEKIATQMNIAFSDFLQGLRTKEGASAGTKLWEQANKLCKYQGMKMLVTHATNPIAQSMVQKLGFNLSVFPYKNYPQTSRIHFGKPIITEGEEVQGLVAAWKLLEEKSFSTLPSWK